MSIQERSAALRLELKKWEKQFAALNSGRKPGRDDIKGNAHIATNYKEYERLRRLLASRRSKSPPLRVAQSQEAASSKNSPKPSEPQHPQSDENGVSVQSPGLTPSKVYPTFVGPTPQKDGIPFGLFDLLSPHQSPHSLKYTATRSALSSLSANVPVTPSKRPHSAVNGDEAFDTFRHARFTRTPTSTGKRFLLDSIVTPNHRKPNFEDHDTPSSSIKLLRTPTFLRRDTVRLDALVEGNEAVDDQKTLTVDEPPFKKKRRFGRSLSAIIRGLKKKEDEEFEDDMEAQREMEAEMSGSHKSAHTAQHFARTSNGKEDAQILVEDSQAMMPLGPDGQARTREEEDNAPELEADGQPRKVWKRKGMKRQTKRVNIRPVTSKPQAQPQRLPWDEDEDVCSVDVPETQHTKHENNVEDGESMEAADGITEAPLQSKGTTSLSRYELSKRTVSPAKDSQGAQSNVPEKPNRKHNAQAHANYRRLKIKSKNSKSQSRGRFGRNRR